MTATILLLAANPAMTTRLALDEEVRAIEEALRMADARDQLRFVSKWAVRPRDLLPHFNEQRPAVVHFSGHGHGSEGLVLQGPDGEMRPVAAPALVAAFSTVRDVRVVVLNACRSEAQAQALAQVVDCVIGMATDFGDEAARVYAAAFYGALGSRRSVADAHAQGLAALMLEGIAEEATPQLRTRAGVDAGRVFVVEGATTTPVATPISTPPTESRPTPQPKRRIALMAADADQPWVKKFHVHMRPLATKAGLEVWDPSKLPAGTRRREALEEQLRSAAVVVLLISPEFLADEELAGSRMPALVAASGGTSKLLYVVVSACAVEETALDDFVPLGDEGTPLDALGPAQLNRHLVDVSREIVAAAADVG